MNRKSTTACIAFLLGTLVNLPAQNPPAPPAPPPASDDVVELSPFTVDASADKGYRATNTLAGSRLNTSLRDTPASVTVFTKELLEDLGLNQIEKLTDYSPSAQMNLQDSSSAPNANNYLGGPNLVKNIDIRGIGASQGLDYFKSITVDDSYRIDRYDESRAAFCAGAVQYLNMNFSFRKGDPKCFSPRQKRKCAVLRGAFAANLAALYRSAGAADADYTKTVGKLYITKGSSDNAYGKTGQIAKATHISVGNNMKYETQMRVVADAGARSDGPEGKRRAANANIPAAALSYFVLFVNTP